MGRCEEEEEEDDDGDFSLVKQRTVRAWKDAFVRPTGGKLALYIVAENCFPRGQEVFVSDGVLATCAAPIANA